MAAPNLSPQPHWVHWAKQPLPHSDELKWTEPLKGEQGSKPEGGLWISDESSVGGEDSWYYWCVYNEYRLEHLRYAHHIELHETRRILTLSNKQALEDFSKRFCSPPTKYQYDVCWTSVRAYFDAVLITPYLPQCRRAPELAWYYGWDCASGVILSPAAIRKVHPAQEMEGWQYDLNSASAIASALATYQSRSLSAQDDNVGLVS